MQNPSQHANVAIVKRNGRFAVAYLSTYTNNWRSGNAFAHTPDGAVNYANPESLDLYSSRAAAMRAVLNGDDGHPLFGDRIALAIANVTGCGLITSSYPTDDGHGHHRLHEYLYTEIEIPDLSVPQLRRVFRQVWPEAEYAG